MIVLLYQQYIINYYLKFIGDLYESNIFLF